MPLGLTRYQLSKQSHFVTFSCHRREPLLADPRMPDLFLACLENTRRRYQFRVYGYVVMPEHVHLLVSEPAVGMLATALQALKVSVVRRAALVRIHQGTLWQRRYYDHNVRSHQSFEGKLAYMHANPVKRGLCLNASDWPWSSCRHYSTAEAGAVEIESQWTAMRREGKDPHLLEPGGARRG